MYAKLFLNLLQTCNYFTTAFARSKNYHDFENVYGRLQIARHMEG